MSALWLTLEGRNVFGQSGGSFEIRSAPIENSLPTYPDASPSKFPRPSAQESTSNSKQQVIEQIVFIQSEKARLMHQLANLDQELSNLLVKLAL